MFGTKGAERMAKCTYAVLSSARSLFCFFNLPNVHGIRKLVRALNKVLQSTLYRNGQLHVKKAVSEKPASTPVEKDRYGAPAVSCGPSSAINSSIVE
jgi:hypothetical protein